jgi:hypothetical protein
MLISAVNVAAWILFASLCGKELLDIALMTNKIHFGYILERRYFMIISETICNATEMVKSMRSGATSQKSK